MNHETTTIIATVTRFIRTDDLSHLQEYWREWGDLTRIDSARALLGGNRIPAEQSSCGIDWPEVWKRAFLLACEREQLPTAQWLYQLYQKAPLGFRLGLRSTFNYARAMARRRSVKSNPALLDWLISLA